ncbi:MAG: type IV pilin [Haloarculaceae archaeon]
MSRSTHRADDRPTERGQSSVVGVALLLAATVVALGVLTASVGTLVSDHAARADAERVAADVDDALRPVETTGHRTGEVRFAEGSLRTVDRDLHVLKNGTREATVPVGGLVYARDDRRVRSVAGAVVRGRGDNAWPVAGPPIVGSERAEVLVIGAAALNASDGSVGGDRVRAELVTNVSHDRRYLGRGTYEVAVETAVPTAFETAFRELGASNIDRRDVDGDGLPSVVATFPGTRRGYLVVHDMRLEVGDG